MFRLLNRFAWVISIILGYLIVFSYIGLYSYHWNDDIIVFSVILGFFLGMFIKWILFSKKYIESRLDFFANAVEREIELKQANIDSKINLKKQVEEKEGEVESMNSEKILETSLPQGLEGQIKNYEIQTEQNLHTETTKQTEQYVQKSTNKFNKILNNITKNYVYTEKAKTMLDFVGIFFSKIRDYIKDFFSTNLLAKLGGLLVFIAVVYLLKGAFEILGPVMKLTFGFIIGFLVYGAGMFISKNHKNEGIVLMGIAILINFAVILSGRYLIANNGFLSEGTTFLFLILNTVFAVVTSLVYKSKSLLILSFIFAYANPLLVGGHSTSPYTLVGYSMIVSLGALFLGWREKNIILVLISFLFGNTLFFLAPFSDSLGWSVKLVFTVVLSIIAILSIKKEDLSKYSFGKYAIISLFLIAYAFVVLNIFNPLYSLNGILSTSLASLFYNFTLILFFAFSVYLIKTFKEKILYIILLFPLLILLGILVNYSLIFAPYVLLTFILLYLFAFAFIGFSGLFAYIFFAILAAFIALFNLKLSYLDLTSIEHISVIIASLVFMISSYIYSKKEGLSILYVIGTIGTAILLAPIIKTSGNLMSFGIGAIIIFAISNLAVPFINKNLYKKENLSALVIASLFGALFFAYQIYNFGQIYFPGVEEGFAFLGLAIVYFIQGYLFVEKLGIENVKKDENLKNVFYSFAGISILLFSIAIAFVFSNYPEIVSIIWLFEATMVYFVYYKNNKNKLFVAGTILFVIGLVKLSYLLDIVYRGDLKFLVSFIVIFASFIMNLYFINKAKYNNLHNIHYILHIFGIFIMGFLLIKIIPSTNHGWSLLGVSLFITILGYFYSRFKIKSLKNIFLIILVIFGLFYINKLSDVLRVLDYKNLSSLKILQIFVFIILLSNIFIWNKFNKALSVNPKINIIIAFIVFISSNIFIQNVFGPIFGDYTLTIYWGIIAAGLLFYGIQFEERKYRTLGLYFLILTFAKIFIIDIWNLAGSDSVIALAVLGIFLIILSTSYTKKYSNDMKGEFSIKNFEININDFLEKIDIQDKKEVVFIPNGEKEIKIKSKNLVKIVTLLQNEFNGKSEFSPYELREIFENIKGKYKTSLDKNTYEKVVNILANFVRKGGKIELN